MSTRHEVGVEGGETALTGLRGTLKQLLPGSSMAMNYYHLSFHMMITFYLTLILVAMVKGPNGKSVSVMAFIIVWHVFAIPVWMLRNVTLRICRTPVGMLVCFTLIACLTVILKDYLGRALTTLVAWISATPAEFFPGK